MSDLKSWILFSSELEALKAGNLHTVLTSPVRMSQIICLW